MNLEGYAIRNLPAYAVEDALWFGDVWHNLETILLGEKKLAVFPTEKEAIDWVIDLIKTVHLGDYKYWQQTGQLPSHYQVVPVENLNLTNVSPEIQELVNSLLPPRRFFQEKALNLYFVKTDQENPRHHPSMHTNHSQYVVTPDPCPGDEIIYILPGKVSKTYEIRLGGDCYLIEATAELSKFSYSKTSRFDEVKLQILSNPGRSPMLGEDGLEDAFGNEQLATLWLEQLNGGGWNYAACDVELIPEPEGDRKDWLRWRFDDELKAKCTLSGEEETWNLVDTSAELQETLDRFALQDAKNEAIATMLARVESLSEVELLEITEKLLLIADANSQEWINRMQKESLSHVANAVAWTLYKSRNNFKFDTGVATIYRDASVNPEPENQVVTSIEV